MRVCERVRTLFDTPLELFVEHRGEDGLEDLVVLCEDIDDRVQRVVTRRRHPFRLLQHNTTLATTTQLQHNYNTTLTTNA